MSISPRIYIYIHICLHLHVYMHMSVYKHIHRHMWHIQLHHVIRAPFPQISASVTTSLGSAVPPCGPTVTAPLPVRNLADKEELPGKGAAPKFGLPYLHDEPIVLGYLAFRVTMTRIEQNIAVVRATMIRIE